MLVSDHQSFNIPPSTETCNDLLKFHLLDTDPRRRAAVSAALYEAGSHVEPFESAKEFQKHFPNSGFLLIYDEGDLIEETFNAFESCGEWFPTVAFHSEPQANRVVTAVLAGALDYLPWPFDGRDILRCAESVNFRHSQQVRRKKRRFRAKAQIERLSRRETEVLTELATGNTNKQIARTLGISPRTVEIHRSNMMEKLSAGHVSDAIRVAIDGRLAN